MSKLTIPKSSCTRHEGAIAPRDNLDPIIQPCLCSIRSRLSLGSVTSDLDLYTTCPPCAAEPETATRTVLEAIGKGDRPPAGRNASDQVR